MTTKNKKIIGAKINKTSWTKCWNKYLVYAVEFIIGLITLFAAILFIMSLSTIIETLFASGVIIVSSASFIAFSICSIWLCLIGAYVISVN
jgi:hypothetical protein